MISKKSNILCFSPTVSSVRNMPQYQRLLHLSNSFDLYVIASGPVCEEISRNCKRVYQALFQRLNLNKLTYPIWGTLVAVYLASRIKIDVVYSMYPNWVLLCGAVFKLFGYRWVSDVHDDPMLWIRVNGRYTGLLVKIALLLHWICFYLTKKCLRFSDLILVIGSIQCLNGFRLENKKVMEIPNGVDFEWVNSIQEVLGQPKKYDFRICYVGHIRKARGAELMLHTAKILKNSNLSFEIALIGPTEPKEERWFLESVKKLGVDDRITRTGRIDHKEVLKWVRSSDITLYPFPKLPELEYVYPIKVFEYLACGKVVIASRLKAIESFIEDGVNGLLFTPNDPESLAITIRTCLDDEPLRKMIQESAVKTASSFDWRNIMLRVEQRFIELIA